MSERLEFMSLWLLPLPHRLPLPLKVSFSVSSEANNKHGFFKEKLCILDYIVG
jgi:hypothetical protein